MSYTNNEQYKIPSSSRIITPIISNENNMTVFLSSNKLLSKSPLLNSKNVKESNTTKRILLNIFIYNSDFSETNFGFYISNRKINKIINEVNIFSNNSQHKHSLDILLKSCNNSGTPYMSFSQFYNLIYQLYIKKTNNNKHNKSVLSFDKYVTFHFKSIYDDIKSISFNPQNIKANSYFHIENNIHQTIIDSKIKDVIYNNFSILKQLYDYYFSFEIISCDIDDSKLAHASFQGLTAFCKDNDIVPFKISVSQLAIYYLVVFECFNMKKIFMENDIGVFFTFDKFCVFLCVVNSVIYNNNIQQIKTLGHNLVSFQNKKLQSYQNYTIDEKLHLFITKLIHNNNNNNIYCNLKQYNNKSINTSKNGSDVYMFNINNQQQKMLHDIFFYYSNQIKKFMIGYMHLRGFIKFLSDFNLIDKSINFISDSKSNTINSTFKTFSIKRPQSESHSKSNTSHIRSRYMTKSVDYTTHHLKLFKHNNNNKLTLGKAEVLFFEIINKYNDNKNVVHETMSFDSFIHALYYIDKEYLYRNNVDNNLKYVPMMKIIYHIENIMKKNNTLSSTISENNNNNNKPQRNRHDKGNSGIMKKISYVNKNVLIQNILNEFKGIVYWLLKCFLNCENVLSFEQFLLFYKQFLIFPDFINLITLKKLFYLLCDNENEENINYNSNTNNNNNYNDNYIIKTDIKNSLIHFDNFMISLGVSSLLIHNDNNSLSSSLTDKDKLLLLFENLIQTHSIKQNKELVNEIISLVNKCKLIY